MKGVHIIAIYHCSIKIIGRGKGRSAVAAAAYRAAEIIQSEYNGVTHDYTRKGGVVHTEILLPEYAPEEYSNRSVLWNAVEMSERNSNAQLAREIEISLPTELTREQNISLAREYVQRNFVDKGMCADVCIHDKNDGNPHAHVMLTMRPFNEDGTWAAKSKKEYILDDNGERITLNSGAFKTRKICTVDWNERDRTEKWRAAWADTVNQYLGQNNIAERVDHRSYERQGIEQIPTVHMGVAASQMEKRGIKTERGNLNREIADMNRELRQTKARIKKVKTWLYAQPLSNPPTMVSIMSNIADAQNLDTQWKKISNLKTQAQVLIFLQQNHISDMAQLVGKVTQIGEDLQTVSDKIKKVDRRMNTLTQHLLQCENFKQHRSVYMKYKQLDPKKRDVFYDRHFEGIRLYESAKKYLDSVLNGRKEIPTKAWQSEQTKLTAERFSLCEDYYRLKDETHSVELLRKGAENIMRESSRNEPTVTKKRDMEL